MPSLLDLPTELRLEIFAYVIPSGQNLTYHHLKRSGIRDLRKLTMNSFYTIGSLYYVCSKICREAMGEFFENNQVVKQDSDVDPRFCVWPGQTPFDQYFRHLDLIYWLDFWHVEDMGWWSGVMENWISKWLQHFTSLRSVVVEVRTSKANPEAGDELIFAKILEGSEEIPDRKVEMRLDEIGVMIDRSGFKWLNQTANCLLPNIMFWVLLY